MKYKTKTQILLLKPDDGLVVHSTHPSYLDACARKRQLIHKMPSLEYRLILRPVQV